MNELNGGGSHYHQAAATNRFFMFPAHTSVVCLGPCGVERRGVFLTDSLIINLPINSVRNLIDIQQSIDS